mgnify:CR=1 FL=1
MSIEYILSAIHGHNKRDTDSTLRLQKISSVYSLPSPASHKAEDNRVRGLYKKKQE